MHGVDSAVSLCVHVHMCGGDAVCSAQGGPPRLGALLRLCPREPEKPPGNVDVEVGQLVPQMLVSMKVIDKVGSRMN